MASYRELTKPWYSLAAWKHRRKIQLAIEPLCRMCSVLGKITQATIADHINPHKGDWQAFIEGDLQSLCKFCHDSVAQSVEKSGKIKHFYGEDGWPMEPSDSMKKKAGR
jgi:5-methylcytosine-specific restriction endonuclease McrA